MNENDKVMTEAESLFIISSMINRAKNKFSENGHLYLLWGWTVFACSIAHFLCIKFQWIQHPQIVWSATWIALICQIIFLSKRKKSEKVKTYTDQIVGFVWLSFAIMMFITIFFNEQRKCISKNVFNVPRSVWYANIFMWNYISFSCIKVWWTCMLGAGYSGCIYKMGLPIAFTCISCSCRMDNPRVSIKSKI